MQDEALTGLETDNRGKKVRRKLRDWNSEGAVEMREVEDESERRRKRREIARRGQMGTGTGSVRSIKSGSGSGQSGPRWPRAQLTRVAVALSPVRFM
jgi:hypothetical protein